MLVLSPSDRFPTGKPLPSQDSTPPQAQAYPWSLRGLTEVAIPDDIMSLIDGSTTYDHDRQIAVDPHTGVPAAGTVSASSVRSFSSSVPEDTLPDVVLDSRS